MPALLNGQIIADHTIVNDYELIPQQYIDSVKKMWVTVPGESHSEAYRSGLEFLEILNSTYKVNITEGGTPEGFTDTCLRFSRATWGDVDNTSGWRYSYGEEDWYTSQTARNNTKAGLIHANNNGFMLDATGFGWCWDMTWTNGPGGDTNDVYHVRWAGSSSGGPQGNLRWGLTSADSALTGNSVCMDTYINATMSYIKLCSDSGYPTKVFFTTGPVDGGGNTGENGYQRFIKHEYIRDFVRNSDSLILFDYADILCWDNDGLQSNTTWTDYAGNPQTYQHIHDDNMLDLDGNYDGNVGHIGERGAVRLAKAMWWMLARMAGWEGTITEYRTHQYPGICEGESFFAEGEEQTTTGIYFDTLTAEVDGLDSIIITHLEVHDTYERTKNRTITEGDSYLAGGEYQTTSGTYYDTLQTIYGCDSIIITNLTVEPPEYITHSDIGNIDIFPNPSNGTYYIELEAVTNELTIQVISSIGREVFNQRICKESSNTKYSINLSYLDDGIYFVIVRANENMYRSKIVLVK